MEKLLRPYALTAKEAIAKLYDLQRTALGKGEKPTSVLAIDMGNSEIVGIILFVGNIIQLKKDWPDEFKALVEDGFPEDIGELEKIENLIECDWAVVKIPHDIDGTRNVVYHYTLEPNDCGVITLK